MDAFQGFFGKYNAVPVNNGGQIDWRNTPTDRLLTWADGDCEVWDAQPDAQPRLVDRLCNIYRELKRRYYAVPCTGETGMTRAEAVLAESLSRRMVGIERRVGPQVRV